MAKYNYSSFGNYGLQGTQNYSGMGQGVNLGQSALGVQDFSNMGDVPAFSFNQPQPGSYPMNADGVPGGDAGGGFLDSIGGVDGAKLGLGAIGGIAQLYMNMKQYGLAKKQLVQSTLNSDRNYAAQKKTTNAQFEDRQRARVASNPGAYQSVGDYMNKYGIA